MTIHNNSDIQVVQGIYEAFSRADVPAILSYVADDVTWRNFYGMHLFPGYWGKVCHNHAEIGEFFREIGEALEVHTFAPQEFFADNGKVVALIQWRGKVRQSGKEFETMQAHIWTLKDNKAVNYIGLDALTTLSISTLTSQHYLALI